MVTAALIFLEALVSYGLAALESVNENALRKNAENKEKKAIKILQLLKEIQEYENMMLAILTAMNIVIGVFYSKRLLYFSDLFLKLFPTERYKLILQGVFFILFMLLLVYLVILFGNVLPRKLALKNVEKAAYHTIGFMSFFLILWKPIVLLVQGSLKIISSIFHINLKECGENVTEEEIISIVNEGLEQGVLENSEVEMISNIIEFDEKEVKDIMTRRQKIVAIDAKLSVEEALKFMLEKKYSRFPVYEEDIDNVLGILFLKDVTKYYVKNGGKEEKVTNLAKKAHFVPDTQRIDTLFQEMQLKKIHMAVAIDEYGQTAGIVAMEDVLEEIVGNIFDEFDEDESMIIKQRQGRYLIKGLTKLEDVAEELGIDMEEEQEDYDTLNGLLVSLLGHIPNDKEKAVLSYKGYRFHIVDVKDNIIRYVRVVEDN